MKKLFYRVKSIQTDKDMKKIISSFKSVSFPSKSDLYSQNQFNFKTSVARGGNRLYITFDVNAKVISDFSSHVNIVTFSLNPPLSSYIGLLIFTSATIYGVITLLLSPHNYLFCFAACIFEMLYIANIRWQITACEEKIIRRLRD